MMAKSTGWTFNTLKEAYAPRDPLQYIADGIIPEGSLSIVYGAPGCLKSLLLMDLLACIVAGADWLTDEHGKEGISTIAGPGVYLDFDQGSRPMAERLDAIGHTRGLADDAPLYWISLPSPWLDLTNVRLVDCLATDLGPFDPNLVVVDNLGNVSGNAEENSAEMTRVMSGARVLTERLNAAVIVVHHQRKSTGFTGGRPGDALRGHSSIEAAIDLALHIDRELGSNEITVTATKTRFAPVKQFGAEFVYTHLPGTRELDTARFIGRETIDLHSDDAIRRTVLEVIANDPGLNKTELTDATKDICDVGVNRIRGQIAKLISAGKLVSKPGPHNSKLYYLPTTDPFQTAWYH